MRVVLFCGGQGLRLQDLGCQDPGFHSSSRQVPKPLVKIGERPILWHMMAYYARHGHRDFIICLGHHSKKIRHAFLTHAGSPPPQELVVQGIRATVLDDIIDGWRVTLVDTGRNATIGERLLRVRPLLADEEIFLANYGDTLTDAPLNTWIADLQQRPDLIGSFICVRPNLSVHEVRLNDEGLVEAIETLADSGVLINGGYFIFRQAIFDHLVDGEELVEEPFHRLIAKRALLGNRYHGFWAAMDTVKDRLVLEELYQRGAAPWVKTPELPSRPLERPPLDASTHP